MRISHRGIFKHTTIACGSKERGYSAGLDFPCKGKLREPNQKKARPPTGPNAGDQNGKTRRFISARPSNSRKVTEGKSMPQDVSWIPRRFMATSGKVPQRVRSGNPAKCAGRLAPEEFLLPHSQFACPVVVKPGRIGRPKNQAIQTAQGPLPPISAKAPPPCYFENH